MYELLRILCIAIEPGVPEFVHTFIVTKNVNIQWYFSCHMLKVFVEIHLWWIMMPGFYSVVSSFIYLWCIVDIRNELHTINFIIYFNLLLFLIEIHIVYKHSIVIYLCGFLHWTVFITNAVYIWIFHLWKFRNLYILNTLIHTKQYMAPKIRDSLSLQWRHNERNDVSNHHRLDCLFNCLFRHISKKTPTSLVFVRGKKYDISYG